MAVRNDLIKSIRSRSTRSGVLTADRYFSAIKSCFTGCEGGFCPTKLFEAGTEEQWSKELRKAQRKLTFCNDAMLIVPETVTKSIAGDDEVTGSILNFNAIVTTSNRDRDKDILDTKGAVLDPRAPLLWQHIPMQPIGKLVRQISNTGNKLIAKFAIADTALGRDAAALIELGALRISHGFDPTEYEPNDDDGFTFSKFLIYEISVVSVPANEDAVITAYSRKQLKSALIGGWAKSYFDGRKTIVAVPEQKHQCGCQKHAKDKATDTIRWNKSLSKAFDIANVRIEPSSLKVDLAAKHIGCKVKNVFQSGDHIPSARMGSFLTGLRHSMSDSTVDDTRCLHGSSEAPPIYEAIQLNSTKSDTFLIDGIRFCHKGREKYVIDLQPSWSGIELTVYSDYEKREMVMDLLDKAWSYARQNNFLKGEAFSLSGEFLPRGDQDWGDVFLTEKNEKPLRRCVSLLNEKGAQCPNRGLILMGEPGTGKTLSGRIIKNKADATFVWISARDFHRSGAFGGFSYAFDLAKELAPSVLFFEDIDNWIDPYTMDLLKTEMDGMAKSSGVVTVLTTNYPERFPDALIDRPGRFHDVLKIGLPDEATRTRMLAKWMPDLTESDVQTAIKRTTGYSGAHIYELAAFAKTIQEEESISASESLIKALNKIDEQRDLITQNQLSGSNFRPRRSFESAFKSFMKNSPVTDVDVDYQADGENIGVDDTPRLYRCPECGYSAQINRFNYMTDPPATGLPGPSPIENSTNPQEKAMSANTKGRMSKENVEHLKNAHGDVEHLHGMSDLPRDHKALCKSAMSHLKTTIPGMGSTEGEDSDEDIMAPEEIGVALKSLSEQASKAVKEAYDDMDTLKGSTKNRIHKAMAVSAMDSMCKVMPMPGNVGRTGSAPINGTDTVGSGYEQPTDKGFKSVQAQIKAAAMDLPVADIRSLGHTLISMAELKEAV